MLLVAVLLDWSLYGPQPQIMEGALVFGTVEPLEGTDWDRTKTRDRRGVE